ncbi:hypothetical protein VB151_07005 [Xanthomonas fragariae]|uniref:hypothetical protein n=1 Tax=Xanthomonas fragariae TaxID=48664 RepID=UPI0003A986D0|nr:hypothetical protein [Xanthomonas fragariae]MBL9196569.1 hypothetical protein [Xanthomonas fragariae]MBL9221539.1 hypothetical protein [Xanthomonas fragariae]MDM7554309.1 hypothetical protein [Xanthomonas fragariae]MDM7557442.1 hypothetical protein [Xanthomonas fragariae]MDM7571986.1 hypothetical protein [Xanthomonas fragariae]
MRAELGCPCARSDQRIPAACGYGAAGDPTPGRPLPIALDDTPVLPATARCVQ